MRINRSKQSLGAFSSWKWFQPLKGFFSFSFSILASIFFFFLSIKESIPSRMLLNDILWAGHSSHFFKLFGLSRKKSRSEREPKERKMAKLESVESLWGMRDHHLVSGLPCSLKHALSRGTRHHCSSYSLHDYFPYLLMVQLI